MLDFILAYLFYSQLISFFLVVVAVVLEVKHIIADPMPYMYKLAEFQEKSTTSMGMFKSLSLKYRILYVFEAASVGFILYPFRAVYILYYALKNGSVIPLVDSELDKDLEKLEMYSCQS